jgi:hypothetical protein
MRIAIYVIALLALTCSQSFAVGAVAIDNKDGFWAVSYNDGTTERAENEAMDLCVNGGHTCLVQWVFEDECVGIVSKPGALTQIYFGIASLQSLALQRARELCDDSSCGNERSYCDGTPTSPSALFSPSSPAVSLQNLAANPYVANIAALYLLIAVVAAFLYFEYRRRVIFERTAVSANTASRYTAADPQTIGTPNRHTTANIQATPTILSDLEAQASVSHNASNKPPSTEVQDETIVQNDIGTPPSVNATPLKTPGPAFGFGIAALIVSLLGIFFPFGIILSAISIICGIIAAVAGDKIFAVATSLIVLVNTFVLSPSTWILLSGDPSGFLKYVLIVVCLIPATVAIIQAIRSNVST